MKQTGAKARGHPRSEFELLNQAFNPSFGPTLLCAPPNQLRGADSQNGGESIRTFKTCGNFSNYNLLDIPAHEAHR
jgi:hypothetical protein